MFSVLGNMIGGNGAKFLADFFAVIFGSVGHVFKNTILNIFYSFINVLTSWIWMICKWVLGAIDIMQFAFTRLLGLDLGDGTVLSLGDYVEGMKDITVSGGSNYYDYIMDIFRALFGVALVLMIVFTIVAMVMQEYNLAINGYQKADNSKGKFFRVILTNILSIFLVPLVFYTIIIGTNSILTSFYRALGGYSDTTVAGNVLAAATYDANRYRAYANANKRIPITISVYEMDNGFGKAKGDEELKKDIQSTEVQEKLRAIAGAFVDNNFLPFEKSTAYNNGSWSNYSNYSIEYNNTMYDDVGMYFENFICTREQYYVLADFIDYCQLYNVKYYIKAISEEDICWKYVDDITVSKSLNPDGTMNGGDLTLDVVYRDAEVVNNPSAIENSASAAGVASNGSGFKTLQLTTKLDLTSPISDALKTASTLLGLEEEDSAFNVMERDDSGDYVNLVEWSNRKVKLKFSGPFDLEDPSTWTFADQIIVYEYFRFQNDYSSTNNTLEDYSIAQIKEGIFLDAKEMTYRNYNSNTETYSKEYTQYCVKINNNYYRIKESETEFDDYGQAYFELTAIDENVDYFENQRISIKKVNTKTIKLSDDFDINDKDTWEFVDQLLIYEYFKDLSLSNGLRRTNQFSDFVTGVEFYVYKIGEHDDNGGATPSYKYYIYINGTYYQCDLNGNLYTGTNFLINTTEAGNRWFGYKLDGLTNKEYYGLGVLDAYDNFVKGSIGSETPVGDDNAMYQKYSKMNMKLSENFSFYNTDTWTFRDYVIMYIYINTLSVDNNITVDSLKLEGIDGDIVVSGTTYYLKVQYKNSAYGSDQTKYIDLKSFSEISEQKITKTISTSQFEDLSLGSTNLNFVHHFSSSEDVLLNKPVSSKQFETSENFDAYDPTTWSIGDYLLLDLIEEGYIDTSVEILKIKGYSALCYETDVGNFYRFGTKDNAYYLCEKKIKAIGYTVEKWFNTNLMSFLLSARYGNLGLSDILIEEDDFADGTVTNADSYLYNITTDISDSYSLQYILAKDFLTSNDIITDVSKMQYSYSNPWINASDLTTWNYLDTIIYVLTGSVATKENPFVSYLYNDGSNTYLKVSDKYVQISSTIETKCLQSGTILSDQIYSDNRKTFDSEVKLNEYYDARLNGMMYKGSDLVSIKGSALTLDDHIADFYYYSKDLPRSGTIVSKPIGKLLSDFDFILARHGTTLTSSGIYTFDAVSLNGEIYIKIKDDATDDNDDWMKITTTTSALIYYKENSLISDGVNAFTSVGTHTAFQKTAGVYKYTPYDAILYSVYGSAPENKEFNKYTCGIDGAVYLDVGGKFVKFEDLTTALALGDSAESEKITYLYNNYYHQFVSSSIPSSTAQYNLSSVTVSFGEGAGLAASLISGYHGFALICTKLGITNITSCHLIQANDGTYYLKYGSNYVNLKNLIDVSITNETGITLNLNSNAKETFRWKYALIQDTTPSCTFRSASYLNNVDVAGTGWVTYVKELNNLISDADARNKAKTTNTADWTWLGLISCYVDPTDTYNVYEYYRSGKKYYHFKNSSVDYFVPYRQTVDGGSCTLDAKIYEASGQYTYNTQSKTIELDSVLDITMKTLGVVSTEDPATNLTRFISKKAVLKEFYLVKKTVGGTTTYHAIYGLSSVDNSNEAVVKHVKYESGTFKTDETDKDSATSFRFTSRPLSELKDWTMLDFIAYYATESIYASTIISKVYVYNSRYYIECNDKFMLIPVLSNNTDDVFKYFAGEASIINESKPNNKCTLRELIRYENYANIATEDLPASGTQCVYNYADMNTDLQAKINAFTSSISTTTTEKPFQYINFSENFDLGNYESWTYSDYVIYYAFINGFYETENADPDFVDYALPFVYVPKFAISASTYYGLTYLDIVLAKICGDDGGSPAWYNYFTDTQSSYNLQLVYTNSNVFYLEYDGHYIPLSGEIGIDFSKMEVVSTELKETLSSADVQERVQEFTDIPPTDYYKGTSLGEVPTKYKTTFHNKKFQTFVNANCAPAYVYYLLDQDEDTGSATATKVINFAFEDYSAKDGVYFSYDKFYEFYDDYLVNYLNLTTHYELSVDISTSDISASPNYNMVTKLVYDQIYPDLVFDNYYYYSLDASKLNALGLGSGDDNIKANIKAGAVSETASFKQKQVNLRLSSAFLDGGGNAKMADPSNWTILDYIILFERSRDNVRHNVFQSMSISELAKTDYLYTVYCYDYDLDGTLETTDDIYLYINNNFYNLKGYVNESSGIYSGVTFTNANNPVSAGGINAHDFKVLFESYDLSINPAYTGSKQYNRDINNISYNIEDVTNFKYIDTNYADTNYRINVANYGKYTVKDLIKKTSWVEKLMTDMQVYYPDLNWGVLIATDGWLDTLGEFTSANINGLFTGGQNSSNTTAPGLVLSEFFMSVATEVEGGYADYEYSSAFDQDTIRALMMSLMGEESYQALVFEAEVFMDYFNSCFAPIIDDFAEEFGESIGDNSLRLNAYKSYLATLLLSSDIGEYLYTIATRVYAEYTIGEYLASAAGDYAGYYGYVNKLKDEDGNTIEAFSYGTMLELIRYENKYCGNSAPTFTFNFRQAFEKYKKSEKVAGFTLAQALADVAIYDKVSETLLKLIDADYETIYYKGYDINEYGKVVDSNGIEVESETSTYIYCYMLHVYWEIRYEVNFLNQPSYLKCYRAYLDGELTRWDIVKSENIQSADQYFESYESEQVKLQFYKTTTLANTAKLFIPGITFNEEADGILGVLTQMWELIKDGFGAFADPSRLADNISVPLMNASVIVLHDTELRKDAAFIVLNTITLYFTMCFSEDSAFEIADIFEGILDKIIPVDLSSEACWEKILQYYESLENIINELKEVRSLLPGETTDRGSSRKIAGTEQYYTDMQLDYIINAFVDVRSNIDKYISTQKRLDQAQKRSITFTLAQYGANYVSSGYEFSVRNKAYTFKPETDPVRLAEYVYGGAFLESVGEGAKYTDPKFTGIVKASKVYDDEDRVLKTNLDTWSELRGFLSKIADQTAELYFTTNLADLDVSKNNEIKISDPISVVYDGDTYQSIEEALYQYIIDGIAQEIGARITDCYDENGAIVADKYTNYDSGDGHERFIALAKYIFSGNVTDEELENITLEGIKRLAMKQVIANEQNQAESPEERADKYMLVFNMLGVQVDLKAEALTENIDRVLYKSQVERVESGGVVTSLNYKENGASKGKITGTLRVSNSTLDSVKVLSGLENRPDTEILTRQYAGIRPGDYYDEAFGDTFIACTYNNEDGLYYPILGTASKSLASRDSTYSDYLDAGLIKHKFTSNYYDNDSNVVVIKGVITADGLPTAVRKYNNPIEVLQKNMFSSQEKTFNSVTYYRTNVGTSFGEGEDLVDASRAVGRITTKNYTKYIQGTSFTNGIGETVVYTGRTNLRTAVSSDYNACFVQSRSEYLMGQADELGAISVLDDFSYFYVFGGQSWILLMLAFITIIPVMVNACGGAASRILDILVLFLTSPVVISTNSLFPEGKNNIYKKWKKNLMSVLMGAFGYIVAFTSFTILVPMVYNINSFISVDTYNKIVAIGGLGNLISYPMVNGLLRYMWVITAASILDKLPEILLPIITANRGDLTSPHPGLGSGVGKKFTDKAKDVVKSAKEVGTILSGKAAMGAYASLKEDALNMIPGFHEAKMFKEKVIDPKMNKLRSEAAKVEEKIIEEGLVRLAGVDPQVAKAAAKAVTAAQEAKKKAKDDNKKRMEEYKKEFQGMTQ